jgi:hypothetical protein
MRAADLAERIGEELARVFDAKSSALRAGAPETGPDGPAAGTATEGPAGPDGIGGMVDEDEAEGARGTAGGSRP